MSSRTEDALLFFGVYGSILLIGGLSGVYLTWLSIALLTLVAAVIVCSYEQDALSYTPSQSREVFIFIFQGIVLVAWVLAGIIRPVIVLLRGGTIRIALDQFIR